MTLIEHLRELRNRLFWSFVAIALGTVVGWIFYNRLFTFIAQPLLDAVQPARRGGAQQADPVADRGRRRVQPQAPGLAGRRDHPDVAVLDLPAAALRHAGHAQERAPMGRRLRRRRRPALPGRGRGRLPAMPHVLGAFLGFTPSQANNIIDVENYVSFLLQISLAFGVGFLAPVVVVALNAIGVLSARRFASWWRWVLFFVLVFAAVATPTGDPFNMLLFATPLLVLMVVAFAICWLNDRRRAGATPERARPTCPTTRPARWTCPWSPSSRTRPSSRSTRSRRSPRARSTRPEPGAYHRPVRHGTDSVRCVTRRIAVLVNPTSGKGRGAREGAVAAARLREHGLVVDEMSGTDGRAAELVARAGGRGRLRRPGRRRWRRHGRTSSCRRSPATGTPLGSSRPAVATTSPGCWASRRTSPGGRGRRGGRRAPCARSTPARAGERWFAGVLVHGFDSRVNERANRMRWPRGPQPLQPGDPRRAAGLPAAAVRARARRRAHGDRGDAGRGRQRHVVRRRHEGRARTPGSTTGCSTSRCSGRVGKPEFLGCSRKVYKGTHVDHPAVTDPPRRACRCARPA